MFTRTLKTAAVAAVVLFATAGASFAAQYAWVDHSAKVKSFHKNSSDSVNWVAEGQKVKIIDSWGNWYKIKIPGQDGWVKAGVLDFDYYQESDWPYEGNYGGGSVCVGGSHASFCIGSNY